MKVCLVGSSGGHLRHTKRKWKYCDGFEIHNVSDAR